MEEAEDAPWWVWNVESDVDNMSTFESGCREYAQIWDQIDDVSPHHLVWKARAFIKDETTGATDGELNIEGMVYED